MPPLGGQDHAFGERLHDIGENQILRQFRLQPLAGRAAIVEYFPHRFEIWFGSFERRQFASDHEGQSALLGPRFRSGAGSIQKVRPLRGKRRADRLADGRRDGAAIGGHAARTNPFEQPISPDGDVPRHVAVADAVENEIGSLGNFARSRADNCVARLGNLDRFRRRVRPQRDLVACL